MKHLISILLFISVMLSACKFDGSYEYMVGTPIANNESDEIFLSGTTIADGIETMPSVRMIREYECSELLTVDSNADIVIRDSDLFIYEPHDKTIMRQTILDLNEAAEQIALITPRELSGVLLHALYPLSDNRYLLLYQTDLLITDVDGNVLQRAQMPHELARLGFWDWEVCEDADGSLHILMYYEDGLYYFDSSLTMQTSLNAQSSFLSSLSMTIKPFAHYIGNDCFCLGGTVSFSSICNTADGTHTWNQLHVPSELTAENLVHGINGEHYLAGDTGIRRYYEDRQPEMILRWDECGYRFGPADQYWVIDDNTILLSRGNHDNGTFSFTLFIYRITKTPQLVTDKENITLLSYSVYPEDWLSNAIYQFNRTNEHYKINLVNDNTFMEEDRIAKIEQILLNGTGADMILPYAPEELFPYFDKNAFVDLNPYIGDKVFGSIRSLYGAGDAMYIVPMSFSFTTLIANSNVLHGQPLTWENFYAVRDSLPEGVEFAVPRYQAVNASYIDDNGNRVSAAERYDLPQTLYDLSLSDYADWNAKTTTYDTDAFRDMILCLQFMAETMDETVGGIENCTYIGNSRAGTAVSNGSLVNRLRDGGIAFAEVEFAEVEHFSLVQRLFGDDASYEICGYPSADGGSVAVGAVTTPLAVLESSPNKEGCIEFLKFLLSPEWQNDENNSFLPVSPEALAALLDEQRYYYYTNYEIGTLNNPGGGVIRVQLPYSTAEYDDSFGETETTEERFTVYSTTAKNRQALLDFFENITIRTKVDNRILEIVNEELSYWKHKARTLEETTRIIDSRVWIYLNE